MRLVAGFSCEGVVGAPYLAAFGGDSVHIFQFEPEHLELKFFLVPLLVLVWAVQVFATESKLFNWGNTGMGGVVVI